MPTKINKSPLTLDPATIISLGIKAGVGGAKGTKEYTDKVGQDLGIERTKGLFGGILKSDEFKDLSLGKKLGIFGKGLGYNALGRVEGVTGMDIIPEAEEPEQPKYTTNINPMTGEEDSLKNIYGNSAPLPMAGKPIKALTQMQGTVAHNMSAKQHNTNQKMNALAMSGIPAALTLKGDQYKIDANKDGEITGEDFEIIKNK